MAEKKRAAVGVNLPRWGLKQHLHKCLAKSNYMCKFTPLGFETICGSRLRANRTWGVNLPRWGLKRQIFTHTQRQARRVNLPRWGLKRLQQMI